MGRIKVDQENEGAVVGKKEGKGKEEVKKSLIPVPSASTSPKNEENTASTVASKNQKNRRALAPVQAGETPQVKKPITGKTLLKKNEQIEKPTKAKSSTSEKAVGTAGAQLHRNFPGTPHNSPGKLKTRKSTRIAGKEDLKAKTEKKIDEKETIAYWKELAESRRQALEAALQENYELHKKLEELEREKDELEDIVKEAEQLANMVTEAAEDDELELTLDESGIDDSNAGTAV